MEFRRLLQMNIVNMWILHSTDIIVWNKLVWLAERGKAFGKQVILDCCHSALCFSQTVKSITLLWKQTEQLFFVIYMLRFGANDCKIALLHKKMVYLIGRQFHSSISLLKWGNCLKKVYPTIELSIAMKIKEKKSCTVLKKEGEPNFIKSLHLMQ